MPHSLDSRALGTALLSSIAAMAALSALPANAQLNQFETLDIQSQSLSETLVEIGQLYDQTIVAPDRLTVNLRSPAIAGSYTVDEAFARALAGTDLEVRDGPGGSLVLMQRASSEPVRRNEAIVLDTIIVEGDAFTPTDGYLAKSASTATRLPVAVDDIPNTVRVLPTELIDDVRATLPQEVGRFVSGVQDVRGTGTGTSFLIRGFFSDYQLLQNGVRYQNSPGDLVGVERVEFVKGPVGALYGGTGPFAGAVNFITKRPLDRFEGSVRLTGGSEDFYRGELDIGGPISEELGLNYRLTAAIEDAGSFRNNLDSKKYVINPTIGFSPNDRFDLRVDGQFIERDFIAGGGFSLNGPSITLDPELTFIPDDQPRSSDRFASIAYESNFEISDTLTWRSAAGWNRLENDPRRQIGSRLADDLQTVNRFFVTTDSDYRQWSVQNDLIFKTDQWFEEVVILVGHEKFDFENEFTDYVDGTLAPVDLLVPGSVNDTTITSEFDFGDFAFSNKGDGVYGQIFVKFTPRFAVLAGLRHDWTNNASAFATEEQDDDEFTPRLGATYDVSDTTTLYANWAQSFEPNLLFPPDQSDIVVDDVEQIEAGLRQYFFDERILASLAVFNIDRTNVAIPDPNSADGFPFISGGAQRSRGVEFDLTGEIVPGWDLLLTYAYTDAEVTSNEEGNEGNKLPGVPDHNIAVLSTYEIQEGSFDGVSFTAGVTYQSEIAGQVSNAVFLEELTRVDLGVAYEWDEWRAAVNISNVTDEESFATDFFGVTPRDPRRVLFSLSRRFGG